MTLVAGTAPAAAQAPQAPAAPPAVAAPAAPTAAATTPGAAPAPGPAAAAKQQLRIILAKVTRELPVPLSLLDAIPADDGLAGAKLGISDNNTTGRFLNQDFVLDVVEKEKPADLIADVLAKLAPNAGFIVADASPATILALADAVKDKGAMVINASAPDEELREAQCRPNLMHTIPSRTMLTDALAQYLAVKRWRKWFLIAGTSPADKAYAAALRASAKRFGHQIVDERNFEYDAGSRRTDGGFEQVKQQISSFTQNAKPHDIVVVADEGQLFGEHVLYRTWEPRPVAGTVGLTPVTYHASIELYGGTQFQNRFRRLANRPLRELDYNVWLAVRAVGEAASRKKSVQTTDLAPYMRSSEFELAAFKGVKTTFRDWNGQLRQPIPVVTPKILVTVSPQPEFLHQFSALDTMGPDKPETACKAYTAK